MKIKHQHPDVVYPWATFAVRETDTLSQLFSKIKEGMTIRFLVYVSFRGEGFRFGVKRRVFLRHRPSAISLRRRTIFHNIDRLGKITCRASKFTRRQRGTLIGDERQWAAQQGGAKCGFLRAM